MKKLFKTIKNHKVITTTICGVFALALVGVIGYNQYKINNTYKALEMGADGIITTEELSELGEIALGETITTADGQQVVVTKDENGNYVVTPQNPTQPITPGGGDNPGGGDTPEPTPTPTPTPGHTHTWVAHKTIVHHPEVSHKVGITCCSTCGADVTNLAHYTDHKCNGGHYSTFEKIIKVVDQAAWDQEVVDYYYCSECGARQ